MSEFNQPNTGELAYLLWERQGCPENRSIQNWLEAEYLAQAATASQQSKVDHNEVDLRMRGLGPLTQSEGSISNEIAPEDGAHLENSTEGKPSSRQIFSLVAGTAIVLAVVLIYSIFKKRA